MSQEKKVIQNLIVKNKTLAVAESCTGGLLSHRLTNVPGASAVFLGGCVAYHNAAKINILLIPEKIIQKHGAVSRDVALVMARNVRQIFHADYGIGTTGIAGPGGGNAEKPVGLVWVAFAGPGKTWSFELRWHGSRIRNKRDTVSFILKQFVLLK